MNSTKKADPYKRYYKGSGLGQNLPSRNIEKVSKFLRSKGVKRVLDFYCGTGRNALFLSQNKFDVYGFDRSKFAINELRARQMQRRRKIHLKLLNLKDKLPYEDNYFDAVIIIRALYQAKLGQIKRNLREIYRITKPGGYVYLESDQQSVWKRRKSYGQQKTNEKGTYVHGEKGDYYHYFTKEELRALLRGYKAIRFHFKSRRFFILLQKQSS